MKFIDCCSGIGGFHVAMSQLGGECVWACDIDEKCRIVYEKNFNIKPEKDLTNLNIENIPDFDMLCAGFPCQPFSKAGFQLGFEDDRGNVFFALCRIIKHHKPKFIVLENVKNITSHDKGNTWKTIRYHINELGYHIQDKPIVLNALNFDVPQYRERVFMLCKMKDLGELPELNFEKVTLTKNIKDIIVNDEENVKFKLKGKLKITEQVWNNFLNICHSNSIDVPKFPIWTDWWDGNGEETSVTKFDKKLSKEENEKNIKQKQKDFYEKYKNWITKNREFYKHNKELLNPWLVNSRKNTLWKGAVRKFEWQAGNDKLSMNQVLWSPRGSGIRVKKLDYSPTLVAMASMIPVYGPESRMLSPKECMLLQNFPIDMIIDDDDYNAYKQAGNAVNVKIAKMCIKKLIQN